MDLLLLAVALFILMLAGLGISLLLLSKQRFGVAELFSLSVLLGSAVVSIATFVLGFLTSGVSLRWTVVALCLLLGWAGARRRGWSIKMYRRLLVCGLHSPGAFSDQKRFSSHYLRRLTARGTGLLLALNAVQVMVVAGFSYWRVLGWDGLLNFESKARLAFLNGGVIPLEFFSDPSRTWMHQSYPLLLPLTENWLYWWLGRSDQELVKIIFLLFFSAALSLFYAGNRRLGVNGWRVLIAPLLIFTVPLALIGDGSASSGYADFPLAVCYLAAVIWLMEFWRRGDFAALRLAGALLAAACWLKQEGLILWLCIMFLVVVKMLIGRASKREWARLAIAGLPGVVILAGWRGFVHFVNPPGGDEFLPLGLTALRANLWRLPGIAHAVLSELVNWRHWGMLWLIVPISIILLVWQRRELIVLPVAVVLPIVIYAGIYLFSVWPSFTAHIESSFSRLLIHVALVAVLMIGAAIPSRRKAEA